MPVFKIEQYEIHISTYEVEAESEARAISKLFNGEATIVDGTNEFVEICHDLGLPAENNIHLVHDLEELGHIMGKDIIPSVRSIQTT